MSGEENRRSQSKDFAMATEAHQSDLEIQTRRRTSLRFRGLACCRFRGHREKVFDEAGGGPWEGECFRESSRLRRFG